LKKYILIDREISGCNVRDILGNCLPLLLLDLKIETLRGDIAVTLAAATFLHYSRT
jgi:hypothetical protein